MACTLPYQGVLSLTCWLCYAKLHGPMSSPNPSYWPPWRTTAQPNHPFWVIVELGYFRRRSMQEQTCPLADISSRWGGTTDMLKQTAHHASTWQRPWMTRTRRLTRAVIIVQTSVIGSMGQALGRRGVALTKLKLMQWIELSAQIDAAAPRGQEGSVTMLC